MPSVLALYFPPGAMETFQVFLLMNVSPGPPDGVNRPGFHIYEATTLVLSSIMSAHEQPFCHYSEK